MKRIFCQKSAAVLLALCIGSTGLPRLGVGEWLTEPAVTAYAADSKVTLTEATGVLNLEGNIKKEDVTAFADNAKVKKVTCSANTVFPADCSEMFQYFKAKEYNLTNADTSAVTDMNYMFNCSCAETIDLTGWDTSKVTNMNYMFCDSSSLTTIYVNTKWVVADGTMTAGTFDGCTSLKGDKGTTVDTSLLEYAPFARIDRGADNPGYLSHHHLYGEWAYTKYPRCGEGGEGEQQRICSICGGKDTRVILPPAEEHSWRVPTYTWTGYTECTAEHFCKNCGETETETAEATETETGVYTAVFTNPAFTTQKKTTSGLPPVFDTYCWEPDGPLTQELCYGMSQDRSTDPEATPREVSSIIARVGCVLPKDCQGLFDSCGHPLGWRCLTSIDLSAADFSKVEDMRGMFTSLPKLTTVILNGVDLKNVQTMANLFYDCPNLSTVKIVITEGTPNLVSLHGLFADWGRISEITLKGITGESLQYTDRMFGGNTALDNYDFLNIDLSFDTSKVVDMSEMFSGLPDVTKLDLSTFNTSSVENMKNMFAGCSGLTKLDLSSFDTSKVEDMSGMFSGCESLKSITVGKGWSTEKVDESDEMFLDCQKVKGARGTVYDAEHINAEYARIDTAKNPGYLTPDPTLYSYVPDTPATCEEPGNIEYWVVLATGTYYKDEALTQEIQQEDTVVPALGHKWSEWNVKPATCTEDGSRTHTCENCQKAETETLTALGHIWGEWEVTKNATCTEDGIRKHTCDTCKETVAEVIPALGGEHEWSDWKVTKKPNCVEDGEQMRSCSKCGEKQILPVAATGEHTWGDWETVTEATYTKDGLKKHACTVCGEEETEVIPMLVSSSASLVIGQIDKATAEILSEKTDLEKLSAYITVAKASYEDLAEGEKALITNYNDLLVAEKYYNALKANADAAALQAALEQANADLAAAKASVAELTKKLETAQADLAAAQEALEAANTDLAAANKKVTDLTAQLKSANEKIAALEAGAEADELLQKEVADLKTQLEAAKKAQASAEADAKTAKANAEKAAAAQASAEAAQAKAEAAQAKAEKELAELKASIGHKIVKVGDVDGDGTVDNKDSMLLSRYVGGWEDVELDLDAADLDRDGKVDVRDAMILSRYVAAWEGYDKYIIEVEK